MAPKSVMKRTLSRGLAVTPEEARDFPFDHADILLCEAMMNGAKSYQDLAVEVGVKPDVVKHRLLDPVRCAWISQQLRTGISTRLGNVMAAVYSRAVATGDPRAAKLLLEQFGELSKTPQQHQHLHVSMDLSQVGNDELEELIKERMRKLRIDEEARPTSEDSKEDPGVSVHEYVDTEFSDPEGGEGEEGDDQDGL